MVPGSGIGPTMGGEPAGMKVATVVAVPSTIPVNPFWNCVALVRMIRMLLDSPGSTLPVPLVPGEKLKPTTPNRSLSPELAT